MAKKQTVGSLKKKLWKLTSEFVRRSAADKSGNTQCVTCGLVRPWKCLQAGHFIPKARGLSVYFDLRNLAPQCYRCNINLGGNGPNFYTWMLYVRGQAVIDDLQAKSHQTLKIKPSEYMDMIAAMQQRLDML